MASQTRGPELVYQEALMNYLISMARTVEGSLNKALKALLAVYEPTSSQLASEIFLMEPRVNEMEILMDEQAVRVLRTRQLPDEEIRLTVATLKITNDLERMGDLAVNIAERVISLQQMPSVEPPLELAPMASAVKAMVTKSFGALIFRNVVMAGEVLESDDIVDRYRDQIFEGLMANMIEGPGRVASGLQFVLATRYLERIADHATNIAEDTIFWLRGLDVRHGRALAASQELSQPGLTQNS
ncbi:MAG TPA: phosphate signaling complex protein PhoU [Candidatus Acidoferrales bacterium]|nr:phosphate signaling complex protein PhoU [Candidatus Acidoferrales bacterium]